MSIPGTLFFWAPIGPILDVLTSGCLRPMVATIVGLAETCCLLEFLSACCGPDIFLRRLDFLAPVHSPVPFQWLPPL